MINNVAFYFLRLIPLPAKPSMHRPQCLEVGEIKHPLFQVHLYYCLHLKKEHPSHAPCKTQTKRPTQTTTPTGEGNPIPHLQGCVHKMLTGFSAPKMKSYLCLLPNRCITI